MQKSKILSALAIAAFATVAAQKAQAEETTTPAAKPEPFCANNSCKGHSDCHGNGNDGCKGNNSCKGHGILNVKGEKECKKKGGKWTVPKG